MKFIVPIIYLTTLVAVCFRDMEFVPLLCLIIATAMAQLLFRRYPLGLNSSKFLVVFVVWVSVIFMPTFGLVTPIMTNYYVAITPFYLTELLNFGSPLFLFCVLICFVLGRKKEHRIQTPYRIYRIDDKTVRNFLLFNIGLSVFCFIIGLGRLGAEPVQLPFHLGGLINIYRNVAVPILFSMIIENYIRRNLAIKKSFWILYSIWTVVEIFAWLSKSVVIGSFIPVFFILFLYKKISIRALGKYLIPLIALFLIMYPVIEIMRSDSESTSVADSYKNSKEKADGQDSGNAIAKPLNRTFIFGAQFAQNYNYLKNDDLFDFSRLPTLLLYGGAARFQTLYIDGYPETAMHSSGTSGLMDPILHGGKGLLYIVIILIFLVALYTDNQLIMKKYIVFMLLFSIVNTLISNVNISSLYNSVGLQNYLMNLVLIIASNRFCYRKM